MLTAASTTWAAVARALERIKAREALEKRRKLLQEQVRFDFDEYVVASYSVDELYDELRVLASYSHFIDRLVIKIALFTTRALSYHLV